MISIKSDEVTLCTSCDGVGYKKRVGKNWRDEPYVYSDSCRVCGGDGFNFNWEAKKKIRKALRNRS